MVPVITSSDVPNKYDIVLHDKTAWTHKNIGIAYEISNAIAVSEKMALAAVGLAKSSKPGRMLKRVVPQIAFMGVLVFGYMRPKNPLSGKPIEQDTV